jgi:GNAT superfamily N-acetyltransferase
MRIVDLEQNHMKEAIDLALSNYDEERVHVPALPSIEQIPDLTIFVNNGLGAAALDDEGHLIGFLGCFEPWDNAFDSCAKGTFSPIHAHGAIKEKRDEIYKRMYQYAANKWVRHQITYHGIALYAHEQNAISALFQYGFGLRCVDAIRDMNQIELSNCYAKKGMQIEFKELYKDEIPMVRELRKMLSDYLGESPCFMYSSEDDFNSWLQRAEQRDSRLFVALDGEKVIAFFEVQHIGENFVTWSPDMRSICGAFCLPEYRGMGISQELINYIIVTLKEEGVQRLGVDFESFNPAGSVFWLKYFDSYTYSVVRRIDECAIRD